MEQNKKVLELNILEHHKYSFLAHMKHIEGSISETLVIGNKD